MRIDSKSMPFVGRAQRLCTRHAPWLLVLAAPASAQVRAYVAQQLTDSVAVIDVSTQSTVDTIAVGDRPFRIALAPDGLHAVVSNYASESLSILATPTGSVIATLPLAAAPGAIAFSQDSARAFVLTFGGTVEVVDIASASVVASIAVPGDGGDLAVSPDGSRLYVADGVLSVIDTATHGVLQTLAVGDNVTSVGVSPDGSRVYVGSVFYNFNPQFSATGGVTAIDAATLTSAGFVGTYSLPGEMTVAPDGSRVWVGLNYTWVNTGYGAGFLPARVVTSIDTATLTLHGNIVLSKSPGTLELTPDGSKVLVVIPQSNTIGVIDTASVALDGEFASSGTPTGLAIGNAMSLPAPQVYCAAKMNSLGCIPAIGSSGQASASQTSGFVVTGANTRNQRAGLLLYGSTGRAANAFQGGTLCVQSPIRRTPGQSSGGSALPVNDCSGVYAIDMNSFAAGNLGGNPAAALRVPGMLVQCQWWGRDPGFPAPMNSTLTDALEYMVGE